MTFFHARPETGKLLAALRRFSRASAPMEAALTKLVDGAIGLDAEREYEAASKDLEFACGRIRANLPNGRLEDLVDVGVGGIVAATALIAEVAYTAAWRREIEHFRRLADSLRKSIGMVVATIGDVSATPPLPRDPEALSRIIRETARFADAGVRHRRARIAILKLSQTPGAQDECNAAYRHLDSIRNGRLRSQAYPEIKGLYPSADELFAAFDEVDIARPVLESPQLDASREYLYDDDLPQTKSEWAAALEDKEDVFGKLVAATEKLNREARRTLAELSARSPDKPFDPAVPVAKALPTDRDLLKRMLDELTVHLQSARPVQEAFRRRKELQASPEVRHALELAVDDLRRQARGERALFGMERIEAGCPALKEIRDLSAFINGYFKDYRSNDSLVLSCDYLETPRNSSQLQAWLHEMGPDIDFSAAFVKPVAALHRKIMDALAKAPPKPIDYAAIVRRLREQQQPKKAALVEYMAGSIENGSATATFEEIASNVHDANANTSASAIKKNVDRTSDMLATIEPRLELYHALERVEMRENLD